MQNKLAKIEGTNFIYRFLYNSRNERIAIGKSVNRGDISWRYDACNGPVTIAEFDESADVDTYFVRGSGVAQGIGDVIAEVNYDGTSEEIHYYLYNHRGDVVCVVNPGSTPNTTYRYDAYGKCYENYGSYTSRYTFSTKEYLPDANLYLYQYRVYDPQAGRWTQRDPIDYADSINLYQFCGNNPVNNVDEYGLLWDAILDAGFILYDVASYAYHAYNGDKAGMAIDEAALAADLICLAIPVGTGGGVAVRVAGRGTKVSATVATKATVQVTAKGAQAAYHASKIGEQWEDYQNNPENWEQQGDPNTEPAKGKDYKGGTSEETQLKNKNTGETVTRHRIIDKNGKVQHEHFRPDE